MRKYVKTTWYDKYRNITPNKVYRVEFGDIIFDDNGKSFCLGNHPKDIFEFCDKDGNPL